MGNHKEMKMKNFLKVYFGIMLFGMTSSLHATSVISPYFERDIVSDEIAHSLPFSPAESAVATSTGNRAPLADTEFEAESFSPDEPSHPDPITPDNSTPIAPSLAGGNYAVGSPNGNFMVSNSGAAIYNLKIEAPHGGPLTPQIGLSYNSQSYGYGLAGFGFNITGISAITRGGLDLFHDGQQKGVTYTASDNFFLDGKRLILQSGVSGQEGATYTLEGDPFTKIVVHGNYFNSTVSTWFEVKTNDGMVYQYGNSTTSRLSYSNKSGFSRIASWYINRTEDKYTNYITYDYVIGNLNIRPITITYGTNSIKNRGITNKISFSYQNLGENSRAFIIEDQQGKADVYLSSIVTSCNNAIYRKYSFTYDGKSDQSQGKWSRLVNIEETNGNGESLPPIKLNWQFLPTSSIQASQLGVATKEDRSYIKEGDKQFFSADLTGDGISDIIRLSPVKIIDYSGNLGTNSHNETYVYISRSKVTSFGSVTYEDPIIFSMPESLSTSDLVSTIGGMSVMDFDGDGYNDLIIPYHNQADGHWNEEDFYLIMGSDVVAGRTGVVKIFPIKLQATDQTPLFATFDTDGNGKDDVVCVEQRKKDGYYPCLIMKLNEGTKMDWTEFKITLPKDPEKMFTGDFNNDGLSDLILLYDGGYKIYFNNGGSPTSVKFTENSTKSDTNFGDHWRILQGDFDGDGLIDFVYNISGESCLWIAHNNGDGTFSHTQSEDIGVSDHASNKDDSRFSIMVGDMDHDGRSDVMVCKAGYKHKGFPKFKNVYTDTQVRWLYSTGTTLKLVNSYTKNREDDALESSIFLGDFDGDGNIELANYGSVLNSTNDAFSERINIYKAGYDLSQAGRITSITDGMGNNSYIQYAYATSPVVYKQNLPRQYPVNTYTLPVSVVAKVTSDNGAVGSQITKYSYEDMRLHIAGKGMLGFNTVAKENITLDTKEVTNITKWDEKLWIPIEVKVTSSTRSGSSVATSTSAVSNIGKNYFSYISQKDIIDLDGNTCTTFTHYDVSKGVVTDETVKNDGDNMYKKVTYSDYQNKAGVWLPATLTMTQKHNDDSAPFTTVTNYSYDDKGNVLTSTVDSGTELALKTTSTYDVYGNILSSASTGSGVKSITKCNEYDTSGRFVIRSYTNPSSAVNTFTYDAWGNVLTENDATEPSNIITTKHTYDGWGRKQTSLAADGTQKTYETGWGTDGNKKYYVRESTIGKPTVTTWYDKGGYETLQETTGPNGIAVTKMTNYNNKGEVSHVENRTGKLTIKQDLIYDERGRVIFNTLSPGKSASYIYGNRSVTSTISGRNYTKTTDAWGNIIKTTDPVGEVEYTYSSIGNPSSIKTHGSTVTMTYDAAGNQTSLTDPDAGTSTYTYAADGTLLTQTDGRGIETINNYDNLGRLYSTQTGKKTITYIYGTSGNENMRLIKQTMDENSVEYTHDKFGRVLTEKRNLGGKGTYGFSYEYNGKNQLAKTSYPGGLEVTYQYDDNGFKTQTSAGNKVIYKVENFDGLVSSTSFMGKLTATQTCDTRGYESNVKIARGATVLDNFDETYDEATDNLLSRKRNDNPQETFGYDNLDRLISVKTGSTETMKVNYAHNGNIQFKTGIGNYSYGEASRPHAVTEVDNTDGKIPSEALTTSFNDFGKIQLIEDASKNQRMAFVYGPDQERWYSELSNNGVDLRTTIYAGEYEKVTENGTTHEFYYLDGNTIVVRQNGTINNYIAFTDNLGSILSVMDENGMKVFDASYDAWGRQTVTLNTIGLHRGYTGHEMLNEFDIINMNGRLYDPVLGRFFSPDNYVQMPDNSQNFNRYSYCLNNPLKYTDPSGNLFGIDDAVFAFAFFNLANSMMQASYNGENVWKAGALSFLSSAASYGIGAAFGNVGSFGHELLRAGAHGLSSGVFTALDGGSFGSGLISGALASGIGSYAQGINMNTELMVASTTVMGGMAAWATGGDFLQGAMQGMSIGLFNHAMHNNDDILGRSATCEVLPDGTRVAPKELDEVIVAPQKLLEFQSNIPVEKPLESVYPEFDMIFGGRAIFNEAFVLTKGVSIKIERPAIKGYARRVDFGKDSFVDSYHKFPTSFDKQILSDGIACPIQSNSNQTFKLPGFVNGKAGYYTIGIDQHGIIFHRCFVPLKSKIY